MQPYTAKIVPLLLYLSLGIRAATKTITLFAVDAINENSFPEPAISNFHTIIAQGVGADGATTYVEEARISQLPVILGQGGTTSGSATPTFTASLVSTITLPTRTKLRKSNLSFIPFIVHFVKPLSFSLVTVVEDGSHYQFTQLPDPTSISGHRIIDNLGVIHSCSLDPNRRTGSCVAMVWEDNGAFGSQTSMSTATNTFSGHLVPVATLTVDSNTPNKQPNEALMSHLTWDGFGYGLVTGTVLCIWFL